MTPKINITSLNDVSLQRTGRSFKLSSSNRYANEKTAIFVGESPDQIDRRIPVRNLKKGKFSVKISDLDPDTRYYFKLVLSGEPSIVISERRVALEGSVNFRDLGGYETADGRRLRWGQVFRSDNLGRLTGRDVNYIQKMGIRMVCDFRTPAEVKKLPDLLPTGADCASLHLPIKHGEYDPANTFERIKNGDIEWMTEAYMIKGYIKNVEDFAPIWSTFFNSLADRSNRPLVFHCTGGKDRAGVCAALVLLLLGVPEETVIQDHGLSNIYIAAVLEKIYDQIRSQGIEPDKVAPYFTAPESAIVDLLAHIRRVYGSASSFLKIKAGVDERVLNRIKADLLI